MLVEMDIPLLKAEMTHTGDLITGSSVQLKNLFVWELKLIVTTSELEGKHTGHLMWPYSAKNLRSFCQVGSQQFWVPAS